MSILRQALRVRSAMPAAIRAVPNMPSLMMPVTAAPCLDDIVKIT